MQRYLRYPRRPLAGAGMLPGILHRRRFLNTTPSASGAAAAASSSSSREVNVAIVRRFHNDLWNRFDTAVAHEIISPSASFRGTLSDSTTDREGLKRYVTEIQAAFPDFHHRLDAVYVDGDRCISRVLWSGTHVNEFRGHRGTGKRFAYPGVAIFKVVDGMVEDCWVVGDTHQMWTVIARGQD